MKKFWPLFWRLFGIVLFIVVIIGFVIGGINHSLAITYAIVQQAIAVGLGVCGIIGLVVVPIELYFEDRIQRKAHVII
jgi:hypothetical protein